MNTTRRHTRPRRGLSPRRGQTLTVRAVSDSEAQTGRTEPLRQHLAAAAALARQLDIPPTEALRIFKAALHEKPSA